MADTQFYGTGRRKTSAARVFMTSGNGNIKINDQEGVPVEVVEQLIILWRKTFPGAK